MSQRLSEEARILLANERRRCLIERMRTAQFMLRTIDGSRYCVVLPGEIIDLLAYSQRLTAAYDTNDIDAAAHLLAAVF